MDQVTCFNCKEELSEEATRNIAFLGSSIEKKYPHCEKADCIHAYYAEAEVSSYWSFMASGPTWTAEELKSASENQERGLRQSVTKGVRGRG